MPEITDADRDTAARIVGSLPDLALQRMLKQDFAQALADQRAELEAGFDAAYEALREGLSTAYAKRRDGRTRAPKGQLLPEDDLRVQVALRSSYGMLMQAARDGNHTPDWRDVAEIVNAVLDADDQLVQGPRDHICSGRYCTTCAERAR